MKLSRTKSSPVPCAAWANRLAALHPDDLTPDEQMALKHHLASCSDCAAVYAAYQQVDARILSLPVIQPSTQQVAQVEALITDQTAHDRRWRSATHPLERSPLPTGAQTRLAHVEHRLSALAAILVVMALAVSAFALFSSRHATSVSPTTPGKVYTVSYSGTVYAIDPGNGRIIWSTSLHMKPDEQFLVSGGKIFLASSDSRFLYALQTSDGHLLWKRSYQRLTTVGGQTISLSRYLASDGKTLYIGSATGIYAWRASDGEQRWHHEPPAACVANPSACLIDMETVSDGLVYVYFDGLYALNATDGTTRWHNLQAPDATSTPLVVAHNHVYVPNYGGSLTVHVLRADTGKLLSTPGLPQATPYDIITDGNTVYIRTAPASGGGADVYALRSSADRILWHHHYAEVVGLDTVSESSLYYTYVATSTSASSQKHVQPSSVTSANESIIQQKTKLVIHVCAVSTKDGSPQWCQPLPAGSLPSTAMNQGIVYAVGFAQNHQGLDAIRLSNGRILWHILTRIQLIDADTVLV